MGAYAAMVLAGGAGRRMGGRDKPSVLVGGVPMRERVLAEVADASPRILVGPGPPPAGLALLDAGPPAVLDAGPPAVLDAGPPAVRDAGPPAVLDADVPAVALLAGDLPMLTRAAVVELLRHLDQPPAVDGVCYVDETGRRQTLCGVWRPDVLRAAVGRLAVRRGGELAGVPLRELLTGLDVREVTWSGGGPPPWFDCDTERDVRQAEEWLR